MKSYTYLLIDLACISIPLIASFYHKRAFYKMWKYFIPANILVAVFFLVWDVLFTKQGIWGFNGDYLIGFDIVNLPIEEVLFFICIPYACTFTYYALQYLIPVSPFDKYQNPLKWLFLVIATGMMIAGFGRDYTFCTGVFTFALMASSIIFRLNFKHIFLAYFAIIPFFLASNGLLTGSLLEEPIVWYNNDENLSFRVGTIPIEDFIYGFLLIALNILLMNAFEIMGKKR